MALRIKLVSSILLLTVFLVACGNDQQPAAVTETAAPAAEQATVADESPTADAVMAQEPVEESAGEDAEPQTDKGSEIVLAPATSTSPVAATDPADWKYEQGKHFTILTTAQGTSSSPDVIEVAEVFWYGCPHCYNFEPLLANWRSELPDDVRLVPVPVMWNPTNEIHARLFYTAEALGKLDVIHTAVFKELHLNGRPLTDPAAIESFFSKFGVSSEQFNQTFRSFAVESKLKRAKNLTQRYRVRGVPLLVVNGKYTIDGPEVKSLDDTLSVAKELVERERQRR